MKHLLIILVFISNVLVAQTKQELIIKFVDEHIGEKVGDGVCRTLISEAFKFVGDEDPFYKIAKSDKWVSKMGVFVPKDSVVSGDVFYMINIDTSTNKTINAHIGIVYGVSETNMSIANQNYDVDKLKESKVEIIQFSEMVDPAPGTRDEVYFFHKN